MSRIQNILEKAERDGAVRRVHTMVDQTGTSALILEAPPTFTRQDEDNGRPSPVTSPARSVRTTGLDRKLVAVLSPGAAAAEQYRALRTRVAQADHGRPLDVILVTSPGRHEGKSLTAANLALTMAQSFQSRICIVDADLRHSRQHTLFGVKESVGLTDVLVGTTVLADALVGLDDQQITMLPAGATPSHPAELLGSTAMRRTIDTLRTQFDRVIIDAPSAGPLADVGILAPLVDGVVLVVQAGVTTKPAIQEAVATIGAGKFLGVVLNDTIAAGA
jgi:capsular exopolysaccharide synthesis family protein